MKKIALLCILFAAACGYTSRDNEMIAQVKKVIARTPLICGDYVEADLSLGVLRNGVGSMSKEDVTLVAPVEYVATLKAAADSGQLVKVRYDDDRCCDICVPTEHLTHVEMLP